MAKKTVADINVKGKKVLMRVDFNVPLDSKQNITNDNRIVQALPTIKHVLAQGGSLILMSHLGRPEGEPDPKYSMAPVAKRLGELLDKPVGFVNDCVGPQVKAKAAALKPGDVLVLENVRFHREEVIKDKAAKEDAQLRKAKDDFAKQLGELADVYVDDAFGTAHRDNASMYTVPCMMEGKPRVTGFLIEKELKFLGETVNKPVKPFVAILGGAKVSDKLKVIENLMRKVDTILIGGGMAYTFFKAQGKSIGDSLCEEDFVNSALALLDQAKKIGCQIVLPLIPSSARSSRPIPSTRWLRATSKAAGRDWTSGPKRRSCLPTSSKTPRPSSGTDRWAYSRWRPLPRGPRRLRWR
jgi:3-phosphoglycerate kinase